MQQNEAWLREQTNLLNELRRNNCLLSGDGRCDSPGHNAKYLTYTLLDQQSNKIVAMTITQCTEAGNSNRMEKFAFEKVLKYIKTKGIRIDQLTTDRHTQIKKYMRECEPTINHQFDIWHVCKNVKKKLAAASKKKPNAILTGWIKSICNHFWWSCATCNDDPQILKEKWISILFHIQNKHQWSGNMVFHACCHGELSNNKEWLLPESEAFRSLQLIVLDKTLLSDMKHFTKFSHTGNLEVYHSLYNKWVPKSSHFSYRGMIARSQLAAIDFNSGSNLVQAKTVQGNPRYNISYSKITKNWSAKPIKEKKDRNFFKDMVNRTKEIVANKIELPLPALPELPDRIAPGEKPDKCDTINRHQSRFKIK